MPNPMNGSTRLVASCTRNNIHRTIPAPRLLPAVPLRAISEVARLSLKRLYLILLNSTTNILERTGLTILIDTSLGMTRSHSLQLLRDAATGQRNAFSVWFCGATTVTEDAGRDHLVPWGLLGTT